MNELKKLLAEFVLEMWQEGRTKFVCLASRHGVEEQPQFYGEGRDPLAAAKAAVEALKEQEPIPGDALDLVETD